MRLGILGGSFDPIHFGHLKIAEFCQKKLNLAKVLLIPSGNPPHKKPAESYRHRFKMMELAIKDYPFFEVSEIEKKTSNNRFIYTIYTLKAIQKHYPQDEIFFFIGEDNVSEIQNWYDYEKLFDYAKFVVLSRRVESKKTCKNFFYFKKLLFLNMPKIDISSSRIRNNISKNKPIDGLLPIIVEKYIKKNKLYMRSAK